MIRAENLVKRYGSNYALNDVSFEIGEGEIVGLLGPNGAGKSTAMNILTGYLSTTSGAAYINGINILENPIEAKKLIGFLPEQPPIYPEMTVIEYSHLQGFPMTTTHFVSMTQLPLRTSASGVAPSSHNY